MNKANSNQCYLNGASKTTKTNGNVELKDQDDPNCMSSFETLTDTAQFLLERIPCTPKVGIICGSGMGAYWNEGSLAEALSDPIKFPYEEIPNFPLSTVKGHVGQLVFGYLANIPVICMQGRFHYYEGYPLWKCALPVRVMKLIGVNHLIVTNAAGGLNKKYNVGDIMLVKDHINMMGFAGNNPLQGPNDDRFGPRFPPMNMAYNKKMIQKAIQIATEEGFQKYVHQGVYTCIGGPSFETVAELKMLNMLGADAVGMSTVHEVITARHCNMTVLAFSLITNMCITDYDCCEEANHEEVIDVGKMRQEVLQRFVTKIVSDIGQSIPNGNNNSP